MSCAVATPFALDTLRQRTRARHQQLDGLPALSRLLSPALSEAQYARVMAGFYCCYRRLEPALCAVERRLPALAGPAYLPRLGTLKDFADTYAHADEAKQGISISDAATYWGVRYVLDGSCHGGRIILPAIKRRLPQLSASKLAYWHQLQRVGQHWSGVCKAIETTASRGATPGLLMGAHMAFDTFIGHFSQASICYE